MKEPFLDNTFINQNCFVEMQSDESLAMTAPYHTEEFKWLEKQLIFLKDGEKKSRYNLVAVGCGHLRYMELALNHCKSYTAIDPNISAQVDDSLASYLDRINNVRLIASNFTKVKPKSLPDGNNIFFFMFNVFPYIEGSISALKNLIKDGDIVIFSSWNHKSFNATRLQTIYYDHLEKSSRCKIPRVHVSDYIEKLSQNKDLPFKQARRDVGEITDILVFGL